MDKIFTIRNGEYEFKEKTEFNISLIPKHNYNKINNYKRKKIIIRNQIETKEIIFNKMNLLFIKEKNFLLFAYLIFIVIEKVVSYTTPVNYVILQVGGIGYQQIFSKEYDLDNYKPYKIYINNKLQILRKKQIFVESIDNIIKLEWTHTYPNLAYMFTNLQSITSIYINNMLNISGSNISHMFYNCKNLQEFIYNNTNNNILIKDASKMFYNCEKLNNILFISDLIVNDMNSMFYNCFSLKSIDLSIFNQLINVNISYFFYNCYNLTSFFLTNSTLLINDMRYTFYNCTKLNDIYLNNFRIINSTNMSYIFYNCKNLKELEWDSIIYDLGQPSDMRSMFYNCYNINNITLPFRNKIYDINMARLFYNCYNLLSIQFMSNSLYYPNDMKETFFNCSSLESLNLRDNIRTDYTQDMSFLFYNCFSFNSLTFNFSNNLTKDMKGMFLNCKSLTSLDLSSFYTPKAEIMWELFKGCEGLKYLDLLTFDTSRVTDMESMFEGCSNLTLLNLNNFNTSKVQYMNKMFRNCISLTKIYFRNINTTSLGTMHQMFYNCQKLEYLDLYSITEKGQSYAEMFSNTSHNFTFCIKENEDIPNIFELLLNINHTVRDCSENCYDIERMNIPENKLCCSEFRYKDKCYNECPRKTKDINQNKICEDFKCEGEGEYYNYEQNNCITNISGFYVNSSLDKTIDKCHEDCETCKEKWTNESTHCSSCKSLKPYLHLGNCYKNCTPGLYNGDITKCKCFNTKCELCSEESLEYDLCLTCNTGYYPIENDSLNYNNWINCYNSPKNYYLSNNIYKPCFSSCEYCNQTGNYENQFCLKCNPNTPFSIPMDEDSTITTYNCYPNCSFFYNFDENKTYHCTIDIICPEKYNKLINNSRRCIESCLNTKKTKYEFINTCYEKCPPEVSYNLNDTDYYCKLMCSFEKPFAMIEEQKCVSNCTIMERKDKLCITNYRGNRTNDEIQDKVFIDIKNCLINDFDYHDVNEEVSIILEETGYTYEILTTNKRLDDTTTSHIILGHCETTLKDYFSIDENDPLYILKIDTLKNGMLNPYVSYLVYYPLNGMKLEQLDLSLCEGDGVTVLFSTNITQDQDLYDKNSAYYNDICYTYTSEDGTDISLADRQQQYITNNLSLCEEGCQFIKYHYDKEMAECSCEVKINVQSISDIKIDKDLLYSFVNIKKITNLIVMKCYFLLFNIKSLLRNIGAYVYLPTFISYIICIILFYRIDYFSIKKIVNDIANSKKEIKALLDIKKGDGDLNKAKNINFHVINYNDPVYLQKMKEMKLPKHLKNRNIKNTNNSNQQKQKKKIKIVRKVKVKKLIPKKKTEVNKEKDNKKGINIILEKESFDVKNSLPNQHKRTLKNNRIIQRNHRNQMRVLSTKKYLMETTNFPKEIKESEISQDLELIDKYKIYISNKDREKLEYLLNYNNTELNSMGYNKALKYDHRTFIEYYFALLKSKHLIITIFETRDYNSRIIKIFLVCFNFACCYAINALFFDDNTMHKIYENKGNYSLLSRVPQIIYSAIISYVIDIIFTFLSLSEDNIISLKRERKIKIIKKKRKQILKALKIKFKFFFFLSFILLFFFLYYTTCFCAVYKNTQLHLLKDSLLSFATSNSTPLVLSLIPPLFRIPALKGNKKCHKILYGFSKIAQLF